MRICSACHTGPLITLLLLLVSARAAAFTHNVAWVFGDAGSVAYVLSSFAPPDAALGTVGGQNPVLSLRYGLRYQVNVTTYTAHPLEILARGATALEDTVLLSMQPGVSGTLEGDASVAWQDDGAGTVAFTVSRTLTNAMLAGGLTPGYRCLAHPSTMRGGFLVIGVPLSNPLPVPLAKGSIRVELVPLATGLTAPLDLRPAPDGSGRLFVTDQSGTVRLVQDGALLPTPFLDVRNRLVAPLGILGRHDETDYDERGLLGFAVHPDFANPTANGFRKVYAYTSEPTGGLADFTTEPLSPGTSFDHQNVVAEWTVDAADPNRVDPASRREILRIDHPQFNHNGGMMAFDPDRYLLIGCGDGGAGNDVGEGHGTTGNGQNPGTIQGSLIRIDPLQNGARSGADPSSANGQYRIPITNPFAQTAGLDEIYAYGLRNPYRFSLDPPTGRLILADVGQNHVEEIDIISAGANAGWRLKEGTFRFNPADGSVTNDLTGLPPGLLDPVAEYDHDEGSAIVGGFVYRGSALPELVGRYVCGDFSRGFTQPGGRLFTANLDSGFIEELIIGRDDRALGLYLKGLGVDAAGELYVLGSTALGPYGTTGVVLRLVPLPPIQHVLTYVAGAHGNLNGATSQTVDDGHDGTPVTAVPAGGYHFVRWSDGVTANPRTDTHVTADLTVTAQFAIDTHTLIYLAGAHGTISGTTPQTVDDGSSGTPVTAVPATGYHFVQWSDGVTANPRTDANVTENLTVTAQFAIDTHTLTYLPGAHGTISGTTPQTVDYGSAGTPVTAVPESGFYFVRWSDGVTANPRTDTLVTADLTVTVQYTVTLHTVRFQASSGGTLVGPVLQTVPDGGTATPVSAVADYRFVFVQWDDGVTTSVRTLTAVTAAMTLTASFRPAGPAAANGSFLARLDSPAVEAGRGLWDVTGTYTLSVAGNPLVLNLMHDAHGKLTGIASYTTAKAALVVLPVKASVKGRNGTMAVNIGLRGGDAAKTTAVSLTLTLTLDAAARQLVGPLLGSVTISGTTTPVSTTARLDLPAPEDGTWTLLLQLTPARTAVTGTALLTLPNGVVHHFRVAGKIVGQSVVLSLRDDPSDPAARGVALRATVAVLEGGWADLDAASIRGFGQALRW